MGFFSSGNKEMKNYNGISKQKLIDFKGVGVEIFSRKDDPCASLVQDCQNYFDPFKNMTARGQCHHFLCTYLYI